MDLIDRLRAVVRAIVGMPELVGQPPVYDRMALYRAQVVTCATDGSTCDVHAEDERIGGLQSVPVRVGIPGATAVVAPGAVVLLGWERGDPARPYCAPSWESGATVTKLVFDAAALELAGNTYSLPKWDDFMRDFAVWAAALNTLIATLVPGTGATGGPAYATAIGNPASLIIKMAVPLAYSSAKVKNG